MRVHAGRSEDSEDLSRQGCTTCNKGGYKGRTGLYEMMEITTARELILVGASALELKKRRSSRE